MDTSLLAPAVVVLGLALTACGPGAGPETTPDPAGGVRHEHASGAGDVVVSIDTAGGEIPVEVAFTDQPELLVMGDGRVLRTGRVAGPSDRWVPVETAVLDEAELQRLLDLADDAGLLAEPPDYDLGEPFVTDQATTTVVVAADGRARTHEVYGLGADDDTPPRAALVSFIDRATAQVDRTDLQPYVAPLRIRAEPVARGVGAPAPWPVRGVRLADLGQCTLVEGDPAVAVAGVLEGVGLSTTHRHGALRYTVSAASVLPGETRPCRDGGFR